MSHTDHRTSRRTDLVRAAAVASVLALAASTVLFAVPGAAAQDAAASDAAVLWLDGELADNGGTLPGPVGGATDWGLTADVALARIATGRAADATTAALAARLLEAAGSYTTWDDLGAEYSGVRVAGALAKVLLVAGSAGADTSDVDGIDLEAELRSLMQTSGEHAGRFSDRNPHGPDNSNGFDQAYAMLSLVAGGAAVPGEAVAFLIAQQCPGGALRLLYVDTPGCEDDADADADATSLGVQALLAVERTPAVEKTLADAIGWMLGRQGADGSFGGAPPTEAPNANSTGLASQSLRAAGQIEAADAAAGWVSGELQLGDVAVGSPASGDVGAIAYDPSRRGEALSSGIAAQRRDQWRRATSQGLLALGAGPFVVLAEAPEVVPSPTTSTTSTTAAPAAAPSSPAPLDPQPTEVPVPSDPAPEVAAEQLDADTGPEQLAVTGSQGGAATAAALSLILVGALALVAESRLRGSRREAWSFR